MVSSFSKLYGKIWVGFCVNNGKRFFLEITLGIFKIALRLRDWHLFIWQSVKILNDLNTLTLRQIFWKTNTFVQKTGVPFLIGSTKFENASFSNETVILETNIKTNNMITTKWTYHKERSFSSNNFFCLTI